MLVTKLMIGGHIEDANFISESLLCAGKRGLGFSGTSGGKQKGDSGATKARGLSGESYVMIHPSALADW